MAISTLFSAATSASTVSKKPARPTDNRLPCLSQVVQMSQAISLTCMALGCKMPRWRWGVYVMVPLLKLKFTSDVATVNPTAKRYVWFHRHIGDFSQGISILASLALLRQGNLLAGGANLGAIGLAYCTPFGSHLGYAALAIGSLRSWTRTAIAGGAGSVYLAYRVGYVPMLQQWLDRIRSNFKPADPDTFEPDDGPGASYADDLRAALGSRQGMPVALAKALNKTGLWTHFHSTGLDAKAYLSEGLRRVLKDAGGMVPGWLSALRNKAHLLSDEKLARLCLAGYSPQEGGAQIYAIYSDEKPNGWIPTHYHYWLGMGPTPALSGQLPERLSDLEALCVNELEKLERLREELEELRA